MSESDNRNTEEPLNSKTSQTPSQQTGDTAYFTTTAAEIEDAKRKMKEDMLKKRQTKSNILTAGLIIMGLSAVVTPLFYLIVCNPSSCAARPPSEQLGCSICELVTAIIGAAFFVLGVIIAIVGAIITHVKRNQSTTASPKTATYNNLENKHSFWISFFLALGFIFGFFGILIIFFSRGTVDPRMTSWVIVLFIISALSFAFSWTKTKKK